MRYLLAILVTLLLLAFVASRVSAVTVRVVDTPQYTGTLKVVPGESRVYEDGSVDWQPAGNYKLQ